MTPAWWTGRGPVAQLLRPLSLLYRGLAALDRRLSRRETLPVPVIVVGNWIAGGAGKTPTLMALLQQLQAWGLRAGVISRGHGRQSRGVRLARSDSTAAEIGDEPLLIHRRCRLPLAVGENRVEAARALLNAHPDLQLLVSDDGLQHHTLPRALQLLVFDRRGLGNGLLLPAGPLRQDRAHDDTPQLLLYTEGVASTAMPGHIARRRLVGALPLRDWWQGAAAGPLPAPEPGWRACAAIARPEAFFDALRALGLSVQGIPLPDHADYASLPWPDGARVLVTEKDAVKLAADRPGCEGVWVVLMDLVVDTGFTEALRAQLQALQLME